MEPQCFDLTLPESHKCGNPPHLINGYILVNRRALLFFYSAFQNCDFLIFSLFSGVPCHIKEVIWNFTQDLKDIYIVGSTVEYSCISGFHLTGRSTIECTENKSWSGRPGSCLCQ